MLYDRLLTRAFPLSFLTKAYSSMAVPPRSFQLDHRIFNESLYEHIRSVWFAGLPPSAKVMNDETAKRWWGKGATTQERADFDEDCRRFYAPALEAVSPEKLALPAFVSYEEEGKNADMISKPFLREVMAVGDTKKKRALRFLALILLFDQMPRNLYRTPATLPLVYNHYDRLAWTLRRSGSELTKQEFFHGNPAYATWLDMPFIHAEDLASQEEGVARYERLPEEARANGDIAVAEADEVKTAITIAKSHRDIVERFGRFPHRNQCLGREPTEEEREWLKTGETFGVKQEKKEDGKDEL